MKINAKITQCIVDQNNKGVISGLKANDSQDSYTPPVTVSSEDLPF
jgi:hypothetical protein